MIRLALLLVTIVIATAEDRVKWVPLQQRAGNEQQPHQVWMDGRDLAHDHPHHSDLNEVSRQVEAAFRKTALYDKVQQDKVRRIEKMLNESFDGTQRQLREGRQHLQSLKNNASHKSLAQCFSLICGLLILTRSQQRHVHFG